MIEIPYIIHDNFYFIDHAVSSVLQHAYRHDSPRRQPLQFSCGFILLKLSFVSPKTLTFSVGIKKHV